jgi:hypothetical protein
VTADSSAIYDFNRNGNLTAALRVAYGSITVTIH